jgi:uncharacterized protein (TIGR02217 family)
MSYHATAVFPQDISYGSSGGPVHNTAIVETANGAEERIIRWQTPRHRYDVSYGIKNPETQLPVLLKFHKARQGRAYAFPFLDFFDYSTNPAANINNFNTLPATALDEIVGTGDGGTTQFQLIKTYTSVQSAVRTLRKPIPNTIKVALDGTEVPIDNQVGAVATVNTNTGVVTFSTAPASGVQVTAGCKFYVPVRFESDELNISIDDFRKGGVPDGIGLIEDLTDADIPNVVPTLGAGYLTLTGSTNTELTPAYGSFIRINTTASGAKLTLPAIGYFDDGGPHFRLLNISANAVEVYVGSTLLFSLQATGHATRRDYAELFVAFNAGGSREWVVV